VKRMMLFTGRTNTYMLTTCSQATEGEQRADLVPYPRCRLLHRELWASCTFRFRVHGRFLLLRRGRCLSL